MAGSSSHQGSSSAQNVRIKHEPTYSVQGKKLSDRISRAQSNSRPNGKNNYKDVKPCYFGGNRLSANQKQSCPPRNVICRNCSKKEHFAKFCNLKVWNQMKLLRRIAISLLLTANQSLRSCRWMGSVAQLRLRSLHR